MGPDELVEALLADCEFGKGGDEVPCLTQEGLVPLTLIFECIFACELHEALDVWMLVKGLGFGVELDEKVEVFGKAAGFDAKTARVGWGKGVGTTSSRYSRKVAFDAGEEFFDHAEVAGADSKIGDVDAIAGVGDAVPGSVVYAQLAIAWTRSFLISDVGERI